MIVLDTNVVSELFRPEPSQAVMAWLHTCAADLLFTSAITRGEMLYGAHLLPSGKRKDALLAGLIQIFEVRFGGRLLAYDAHAADAHAEIAARRRALGRPSSQTDLMIAGIVYAHGATLATRNLRDFEDCGIPLINPWH